MSDSGEQLGFSAGGLVKYSPVIASLIFHLTILSVCAIATFSIPQVNAVSTVVSAFSDENQLSQEVVVTERPLHELAGARGDEQSLPEASSLLRVSNSTTDAAPKSEEAIPVSLSPTGLSPTQLTEQIAETLLSSAMKSGGNGDADAGDGTGSGDDFFSMDLKGTSVVFVVDASSSMNFPHPGPAKTRFGRVKLELIKTIGNMNDSDKFFMIFFNELAIPMPANALVDATPENRQAYLTWMAPAKAGGDTEPEVALHAAISLKPQVIYFLTDGRFKYNVVKSVTAANRSGVVINTLCFGDDQGEKFLKQLADNNGGVYKFIPDEPADNAKEKQTRISKPQPPKLTKLPLLGD